MMPRFLRVTRWAAAVMTVVGAARAETPDALAIRLEGAAPGESTPLRAAISRELPPSVALSDEAAPTTSPSATRVARLVVIMSESSASVRYDGPDGRVLERTIELPTDPAKRREVVALLVANLVRDEASDLEAALRGPPRLPSSPPAALRPA